MTNVAAIVVLAFAAIIAFSEVSAYKTTITTTTIDDNGSLVYQIDGLEKTSITTTDEDNGLLGITDGLDNPSGSTNQCRRQIQGQQLNHCQMHITQPRQQQHLQMCCNQLRQVEEQCQCEAIQKVVQQTLQQQQQGGRRGTQGIQQRQILEKAQMIPNQCNLEIQDYCRIPIRIPY
uniref:PawS-like protein 1a n=1 Tax=Senecio pinnatifolius var. maritimus TaxID=58528 RepID=A0A1V0JB47_9ASTR|nr:PawS-like protein 1a [Senecio pinnatifolius var. maritimus]